MTQDDNGDISETITVSGNCNPVDILPTLRSIGNTLNQAAQTASQAASQVMNYAQSSGLGCIAGSAAGGAAIGASIGGAGGALGGALAGSLVGPEGTLFGGGGGALSGASLGAQAGAVAGAAYGILSCKSGGGSGGGGTSSIPGRPYTGKNAAKEAFGHLEKFHGLSPEIASERLHIIKAVAGLGPADDVAIGRTGDVYNAANGEWIGSLTMPQ